MSGIKKIALLFLFSELLLFDEIYTDLVHTISRWPHGVS